MTARQHHYVPQCYLKGFVRDREKPKLFVVDAKEMRSFVSHPKNVAVERDFHTIDAEGFAPDALENDLSIFEGKLDQALKRIIAARSIRDENDRAILLNFICMLSIKNPGRRESFRGAHEQTAKIIMDMVSADPGVWAAHIKRAKETGIISETADEAKMREFFRRGSFTVETPPAYHVQLELGSFEKALPLFFKRKWRLFRAPANSSGFVTCDHPTCLSWSDIQKRGGNRPPGHGLLGTQLLFPVSKELAMIGAFEIENSEGDASEMLVAEINGEIVLNSARQVFACDEAFQYIMGHNSRIMRGLELLEDQRSVRPQSDGN
jgi:hypothetical protein